MNKRTLVDKLEALQASPSCHPDLKQAVKNYLVALAAEQLAAKNLVAELEDDITPIDDLVAFTHSKACVEKFGAERAKLLADNADALKAAGAKYCNCLACTLALEILNDKDVLLS